MQEPTPVIKNYYSGSRTTESKEGLHLESHAEEASYVPVDVLENSTSYFTVTYLFPRLTTEFLSPKR